MAAINRTGMGNRTIRQYNRVANDIFNFVNSYHGSDGLHSVGDQWYTHHGTNKTAYRAHTSTSTYYPTYASTSPPKASSRHITRHSSR
jgi:hypothetical protein